MVEEIEKCIKGFTVSTNYSEWVQCFDIAPMPIIHIGAHLVEERDDYRKSGFEPVFWIEAVPELAAASMDILNKYKNQSITQALVSHQSNIEVDFYLAGPEFSSSSRLEPHLIKASHPEVETISVLKMTTVTLDDLERVGTFGNYEKYFLILDMQGSESEAVIGATNFLEKIDYIISEVSIRELYRGGMKFTDFSKMLEAKGFFLLTADINGNTGWGEAIYCRSKSVTDVPRRISVYKSGFGFGIKLRTLLIKLRVPSRIVFKVRRSSKPNDGA